MALTYQSSSGTYAATGSTVSAVTNPSGLTAGDLCLAFISTGDGDVTLSAINGWTLINSVNNGDGSGDVASFRKIVTGTDVTNGSMQFCSWSGNRPHAASILRFSITGDLTVGTVQTVANSTNTGTTGAVDLVSANHYLIAYGGSDYDENWTESASNAQVTITERNQQNGTTASIGVATGVWDGTGGTTSTATLTRDTSNGGMAGAVFVIGTTTNVSVTADVVTATFSVQAPTVTVGINVSPDVVTATLSLPSVTITITTSDWTNQSKNTSTFVDISKNTSTWTDATRQTSTHTNISKS